MAPSISLAYWGLLTVALTRIALATDICNNLEFGTTSAYSSYNGTLTSPDYPFDYGNYKDCSMTIKASSGFHVVKVVFTDFSVSTSYPQECLDNYLAFYDGVSRSDTKIGQFCGTAHPNVIYSSGRHLYVRFVSDSYRSGKGFSFLYSEVPTDETSGICVTGSTSAGDLKVTSSSGRIFTPNFPVPFKNGMQCSWVLTVPVGKRVRLTFDSFYLSSESFCVSGAEVTILDGRSKEIGSYCGSSVPPVIESSTGINSLRIEFTAGYEQNEIYQGFTAHFEAFDGIPPNECVPGNPKNNDLKLNGSYGVLKSPLYPDNYPPSITCMWLIMVPNGKIVKLTFNSFDVEYDSHCLRDYVMVRDGKYETSKEIGTYCGHTKPDGTRSSDRYMRVQFRSDSDTYSFNQGFKATFQAVDKSNTALIVGVIVGVVAFICVIICCVCIAKRSMKPKSTPPVVYSAVSRTGAPQSVPPPPPQAPFAQPYPPPRVTPYPPPSAPPPNVGYGLMPEALYPAQPPPTYPDISPPPYPGTTSVPQYPPPGQQYPWVQDQLGGNKPSAPPQNV